MEQDSLEEYIKLIKNTKEPKQEENKILSFITTTLKKRESEDRAIKIVELLIEGSIRPETFLKSVAYLNSSYYQDIIEERAITKICGYPLCGRNIQALQNKRYTISTKNNKVYDLEEYGYFCSIYCYNASNHIKSQIDDSPLWLREFEDNTVFNLLPKDIKGHSSEGITLKSKLTNEGDKNFTPIASFAQISLDEIIDDKNKIMFKLPTVVGNQGVLHKLANSQKMKRDYSKLDSLIELKDEDISGNFEINPIDESQEKKNESEQNKSETANKILLKDSEIYLLHANNIKKSSEDLLLENEKIIQVTSSPISNELEQNRRDCLGNQEKVHSCEDLMKIAEKTERMQEKTKVNNIEPIPIERKAEKVENLPNSKDLKSVNEKIKNKLAKSIVKLIDPLPFRSETSYANKCMEQKYNSNHITENETKLKNISLIKLKFHLKNPIEVEDQINNAFRNWISLDTLMFIHGENRIREILDKRKLTEYFDSLKVTQLEAIQQQKYMNICKKLKLQEILEEKWDKSCTDSSKIQPLPDYVKLKQETKAMNTRVKTFYGGMLYEADDSNFPLKKTMEKADEGIPAVLPLVDANSQNALRRRVLLNALNKGAKFYLDIIRFNSIAVLADLQDLVKTFKLTANNVIFKPIVWNYLSLICLKILALRNENVRNALNREEAIELEYLILEQLPRQKEVISNCLRLIQEVDIFIENYIMYRDA